MYRQALSQSRQHLLTKHTPLPRPSPLLFPNSSDRPRHYTQYKPRSNYLIPQAYRRRDDTPHYDKRKIKRHSNNRRRKVSSRYNTSLKRKDFVVLTSKTLEEMEKELSVRLNEYSGRLNSDFKDRMVWTGVREERERDYGVSLLGDDDNDTDGGDVKIADLYATEEAYTSLSTDFKKLIVGLCGYAESIRDKKHDQNRDRDNYDDDSDDEDGSHKEYKEYIGKAESYLEAFEQFHDDRMKAVTRGRKLLEEKIRREEGGGQKVLKDVGSFLRGVFTNPLSTSVPSEFEESWQKADGVTKPTSTNAAGMGEISLANYDELIQSHKSAELHPDIELYEHVLSANLAAYCFGTQAKLDAASRSNRILSRWISLHCPQSKVENNSTNNTSAENNTTPDIDTAPNTEEAKYPEQRLFHTVMRQNADLWTKDGIQRTEEWLRRMESLHNNGYTQCAPDIHAYNLVLLSYCNLSRSISMVPQAGGSGMGYNAKAESNNKNLIVGGVVRIFDELNELEGVEPNRLSLNLALMSLSRVGRKDTDICQRTDRLLCQVLGEEAFNRIIDENASPDDIVVGESADNLQPDLESYHWLVNVYSASGNLYYIQRAMSLLDKMVQKRKSIDSNTDSEEIIAPSSGTFNNALRALQCKIDELHRLSHLNTIDKQHPELKDFSPLQAAKSLTPILDNMLQFESSLPTRVTFLFMMQIWYRSKSAEAGDQAEELLSRMQIFNSYNSILPFSNAYKIAMLCWWVSADAGRAGAADRAYRLLEIIEAQSGDPSELIDDDDEDTEDNDADETDDATDPSTEHSNVFDSTQHNYVKLYFTMLKICAASNTIEDAPRALEIAHETYHKMINRGIKPKGKSFELMYSTVNNYIHHYPDTPEYEKKRLKDTVFAAAEKNGVSRGELVGRWQHVRKRERLKEATNVDVEVKEDSEEESELVEELDDKLLAVK